MWSLVAAVAMSCKELNTAEAAFAALDETAKLHWVSKVKAIPTEEGRAAELALYRRRPDEAEAILVQVRGHTGAYLAMLMRRLMPFRSQT